MNVVTGCWRLDFAAGLRIHEGHRAIRLQGSGALASVVLAIEGMSLLGVRPVGSVIDD
jgi:hypothetical protein